MEDEPVASEVGPAPIWKILAGSDTALLIEILKFLVVLPPPGTTTKSRNGCEMLERIRLQSARNAVRKSLRTCRCVSKLWSKAISEIMSPGIPGVISTSELARLKTTVGRLDLSSIDVFFIQHLKENWGNDVHRNGQSSLQVIVQYRNQSLEAFARSVSLEYKKFLLVKAVEEIAARNDRAQMRSDENTLARWKEKCQPSHVVDLYWHSHMLSPRKYHQDCVIIAGDVIDHLPLYKNPGHCDASDFQSKLQEAMRMESFIYPKKGNFLRRALFETKNGKYEKDLNGVAKTVLRVIELETCCG